MYGIILRIVAIPGARCITDRMGVVRITGAAISLNVDDVTASADFLSRYFGFRVVMSADGFVSLTRDGVGFNVVFLRTGLPSLQPERLRTERASGLILAFVVTGIDQEYQRIRQAGVEITTKLQTEPWGERFFQVTDPNGVIIQLVEWVTQTSDGH
jgi:catechol 2,3-dioxygenase-like lactoylglutathione lyase family enzyme